MHDLVFQTLSRFDPIRSPKLHTNPEQTMGPRTAAADELGDGAGQCAWPVDGA